MNMLFAGMLKAIKTIDMVKTPLDRSFTENNF
jgi:hypothetical protein